MEKDDNNEKSKMIGRNNKIIEKKIAKYYRNSMLKLVVAIVGVITCMIMWIVSLMNHDGLLRSFIWLICVLVCATPIIEVIMKRIKAK